MGCITTTVCVVLSAMTLVCQAEIDFIAERLPLQGLRPDVGTPWPMPVQWIKYEGSLNFDPHNLTFDTMDPSMDDCDLLTQALQRFRESVEKIATSLVDSTSGEDSDMEMSVDDQNQGQSDSQGHGGSQGHADTQGQFDSQGQGSNEGTIRVLRVQVDDRECPVFPSFGMVENYTIIVHSEETNAIYLRGHSVWGVIRGLETILQLLYTREGKWKINLTLITDSPRFGHRGLHLDTARHFYPLDVIKTNLAAMAMNKLNVFHWHIVDAQSFPYESINFPELSREGAFSSKQVYTQEDIAEVIEYARLRGIRVLVEFDTPGHAHSWGKAMPELLTPCFAGGYKFKANYSYHADRENFDPTKNSTFTFLRDFFEEVKDVFPDEYLHLGMDEAHYMCWESSPEIAAFMESMGFGSSYTQLEQYYNNRLLRIVQDLGKKSIIWEDPINNGAVVPGDTIVQVWKNDVSPPRPWTEYLKDSLNRGYDVILSSCWYLNYIKYGQDWKDFYSCEPTSVDVSDALLSHIVGGEACVWSEYLDETNILQNIWPRASAVAERLWSEAHHTDTDQAAFRLDQHRCRMLRLGIPAQPILPGFCREDYNTDNENVTTTRDDDRLNNDVTSPDSDVTTEPTTLDLTEVTTLDPTDVTMSGDNRTDAESPSDLNTTSLGDSTIGDGADEPPSIGNDGREKDKDGGDNTGNGSNRCTFGFSVVIAGVILALKGATL